MNFRYTTYKGRPAVVVGEGKPQTYRKGSKRSIRRAKRRALKRAKRENI